MSSTVLDQSQRQQEPLYNNEENAITSELRNGKFVATTNAYTKQDDNESNHPPIINEVNSPYSQAAILQAAPSLMSIRSCFVSSPSQSSHPPTHPSLGRQPKHAKNNLIRQNKTNGIISNHQQSSSPYRTNKSNANYDNQQIPMTQGSNGSIQQTQSQPQLSSPCYSSQPFLASTSGNNQYKKQSAIPSQTVLQYKNGVLQLTSISGGHVGPRGMSSSADKLTLPATHHNSNTSLPFHEQVKNLSKLVKKTQNINSKHSTGSQSNQNVLLSGSSNYKLDSSGSNSISSSLQSEIDIESLGMQANSRMIQVGNLFGNVGNKVGDFLFLYLMSKYETESRMGSLFVISSF